MKSTEWGGVRVFEEWKSERGKREDGQICPGDLLDNPDTQQLIFWLSRFVTEVRKQNSELYPPQSIQLILAALQRRMLEKNPDAPKFMDQSLIIASSIELP